MDEMKKCPFCGQMIKSVAKKCRYCGNWLENASQQETTSGAAVDDSLAKQPANVQPQPQVVNYQAESRQNTEEELHSYDDRANRQERTKDYAKALNDFVDGQNRDGIVSILQDGFALGIRNFINIFLASLLWIITIWVPYINVGTTIAIFSMPRILAKNSQSEIPPCTFIFDSCYRQYMGEFFLLSGMMLITLIPAYAFTFIPGLIISLGWSMALYIMLDEEISPSEALTRSTKMTYGYKVKILAVSFCEIVLFVIAAYIISLIGEELDVELISFILFIGLVSVFMVAHVGCTAVLYRNMKLNFKERYEKQ